MRAETSASVESIRATAEQTLEAHRTLLEPLLEEHKAPFLETVNNCAELARLALRRESELHIALVGESQVGKSSLLNAFLGSRILPAGGVGPLTARATYIAHAPVAALHAHYEGARALNQILFGIRSHLDARRGSGSASPDDPPGPGPDDDPTRGEYMLAQARRLFASAQTEALTDEMVSDALRLVLAQDRLWPDADLSALEPRIREIQGVLGTEHHIEESPGASQALFRKTLASCVTGPLAPLISKLDLALNAACLEGLRLVDLPGIGVFSDAAGQEASTFVRAHAQSALVFVVRNNGMTEELVRLLETAGVITRLLFSSNNARPAIHVAIVVTHIDNVVRERHAQAREDAELEGRRAPSRDDVFRLVAAEMDGYIRDQVSKVLRRSESRDAASDDARLRRDEVIDRLVTTMNVLCTSAPDYLDIRVGDGGFLQTEDATGIPALATLFHGLADELRLDWRAQVAAALRDLCEAAGGQLDELLASKEDEGRKDEPWRQLIAHMEKVSSGLEQEMAAYHGDALANLRDAMPAYLETLTHRAADAARRRLASLRKDGARLPYRSLDAALRRGGAYTLRKIDYPGQLTLALIDEIATAWPDTVIARVRSVVATLAERDLSLVERLCDEAARFDHDMARTLAERQRGLLRQAAATSVKWTDALLEQLRTKLQGLLQDAIGDDLASACEKARLEGANRGEGAKARILDVFHEAGTIAIARSQSKVLAVLRQEYDRLLQQISRSYLEQHANPLAAVRTSLTGESAVRADQTAAQRLATTRRLEAARTRVTELLAAVRAMEVA
jgi:hypothetical protein